MTTTEPRTEPLATQVVGDDKVGRRRRTQSLMERFRARLSAFFRRFWIWLLIIVVAAASSFFVYRLRGIFGVHGNAFGGGQPPAEIKPFNPKSLLLEVTGPPGSTATINYIDQDSKPRQVLNHSLPWSYTLTTTEPSLPANLVAQGTGSWIACKISLDDNNSGVWVEKAVNHSPPNETVNAFTFCLNKSA
jgi:hypothetical protein